MNPPQSSPAERYSPWHHKWRAVVFCGIAAVAQLVIASVAVVTSQPLWWVPALGYVLCACLAFDSWRTGGAPRAPMEAR